MAILPDAIDYFANTHNNDPIQEVHNHQDAREWAAQEINQCMRHTQKYIFSKLLALLQSSSTSSSSSSCSTTSLLPSATGLLHSTNVARASMGEPMAAQKVRMVFACVVPHGCSFALAHFLFDGHSLTQDQGPLLLVLFELSNSC